MHGRADLGELVEFAFESRVAAGLPVAALLRMSQASRRFNVQSGLTGELHLTGESFRYRVEGPCGIVQPLAARILADRRHESIRITAFRALEQRRFVQWEAFGFDPGRDPGELSPAGLIFLLPAERTVAPRRASLARGR